MSLQDLQKNIDNNVQRQGSAFASADEGATWYDFGQIANAELTFTPVNSDPDTSNRPKTLSFDAEMVFALLQTSATELGAIPAMTGVGTANGLWIKMTNAPTRVADAAAADGYVFKQVLPNPEGSINFQGEGSMITLTSSGRVSVEEMARLGTNGEVNFDA